MSRLVQLQNGSTRCVARVEEPCLRLLSGADSVYELAVTAVAGAVPLPKLVDRFVTPDTLSYDEVYSGRSAWKLLVPFDHPEPARCMVSGTGLTHLGSASSRNAMHGKSDDELTDSMRMFRAGLEGGRPAPGTCGTPPEWFYKGSGTILRACHETLVVPGYAEDGGEEAEVAGVYLIGPDGRPYRVGMAAGNEFSDHVFEKRNYLNLAGSKLRTCALGPELAIDPDFRSVAGQVAVERDGRAIWQKDIATGETEMCHSLANIEYHHFKFDAHRRPGDAHVHYYGAHSLSFADSVRLQAGDVMAIRFEGFGRVLRNPVAIAPVIEKPFDVQSLASA
jgi:hypothetical protein